jgi:hypothetical protein
MAGRAFSFSGSAVSSSWTVFFVFQATNQSEVRIFTTNQSEGRIFNLPTNQKSEFLPRTNQKLEFSPRTNQKSEFLTYQPICNQKFHYPTNQKSETLPTNYRKNISLFYFFRIQLNCSEHSVFKKKISCGKKRGNKYIYGQDMARICKTLKSG